MEGDFRQRKQIHEILPNALLAFHQERHLTIRNIDLKEFSDEIDQWIIDVLVNIGCDTAKSVLAISKEDLINRTDLEEETVDDVIRILKAEFEDEPAPAKEDEPAPAKEDEPAPAKEEEPAPAKEEE